MSLLPTHHSKEVVDGVEEKNSFMVRPCVKLLDYWIENPTRVLVVWLISMLIMAILISSNGDRTYDSNDSNDSNSFSE